MEDDSILIMSSKRQIIEMIVPVLSTFQDNDVTVK